MESESPTTAQPQPGPPQPSNHDSPAPPPLLAPFTPFAGPNTGFGLAVPAAAAVAATANPFTAFLAAPPEETRPPRVLSQCLEAVTTRRVERGALGGSSRKSSWAGRGWRPRMRDGR